MEAAPSAPIIRRRFPVESAAIAGIVYAVLTAIALALIWSIPDVRTEADWSVWIADAGHRRAMTAALSLGSVASVAFLWFVAVIRRRVGDQEDRFFSTVFLGSALVSVGLSLVAMAAFAAPAMDGERSSVGLDAFRVTRGIGLALLLVAAPRVQAVFIASTSTIFLRTRVVPNWLAYLGYAVAAIMFVVPFVAAPVGIGLPIFVLVSSVVLLVVVEGRPASDDPGSLTRRG